MYALSLSHRTDGFRSLITETSREAKWLNKVLMFPPPSQRELRAVGNTPAEIYPKRLQVVGISMRYECREQGAKVQEYLWYFKT